MTMIYGLLKNLYIFFFVGLEKYKLSLLVLHRCILWTLIIAAYSSILYLKVNE